MEDQRIRNTKNSIRQAFINLLTQKKIEQISVTEICSAASVNRATFYRYYTSPYDLLDSLQNNSITEVSDLVKDKNFDLGEMLATLFHSTYNNKDIFIPIFSGYSRRMYSKMSDYLDDLFDISSKSELEQMSYRFLTHGICGLFSDWVSSGMKMDPDTFTNYTLLLCRSMYDTYNKE